MPLDEFLPDGTLYPDCPPPERLETLGDRVDFLARLCGAWDFGLLPEADTVTEIRKPEWLSAVDACDMPTAHSYHLLRRWHGLPEKPYLGQRSYEILNDSSLAFI
ncbi:hypothetical protein DYH09_09805 [bacterium CPR1]|nr:hypothetical protein [bacterium CPR1]